MKDISGVSTGLLKTSINNCTNTSRAAAQFAYDILKNSQGDLQLTITIKREKYEASFVTIVTTESSEGTRTEVFYDGWLTTSKEVPAGSSPKRRKRRNVE